MTRYHDCATDPILRKDLRIEREVLGPALLRLVLGWGTAVDVAIIEGAIELLKHCLPEGEPPHAGTRRRETV